MKVMKRFLAMVLTLAMVATLFAGLTLTASAAGYSGTGDFKKCTGALSSGYYVFGTGSATSVNAVNNTVGSSWAVYTATSVSSGTIKNPSTNIVWYYDSSTGKLQSAGSSNYIYWPTTGNTGGVGATGRALTITETGTSGIYNVKVADTPARLFRQNGTSGYRFYSSSTGVADIYFYKLESKTLSSIAISSSNHRSFTTGATFVGETVTATYSDSSTATVNATFSGYNMNTAGSQTVTASYTEGGVTKTATYPITVTAPTPYTLTYSVNGDTSVISGGTYNSGSSVTLPANVTAPAGYTFAGWVASAIGTETTTAPTVLTGSYTMPAANTTLYALFTRTEEVQGGSSDKYELVTSASSLAAGDKILIVGVESGSYYALKPYVSGNNCGRNAVSAPVSNVITTTVADLTLGGSAGAWTLFDGTYYLYAAGGTGSSNYLKGAANANNANAKWTISFSGNNATIKTTDSTVARHTIMHNTGSDIFSCYASGQAAVSIYKQKAGTTTTTYYTTTVQTPAVSHTLTYSASPAAGGSITCASTSGASIEEDTPVSLTAAANQHYTFTGWTVNGASAGSNATLNITMDADKTVVANFTAEPTYTVTLNQVTGGTMTASKYSGIYAGETVTLTAAPSEHYSFNGWQITPSVTVTSNSFTMPAANVTITGSFTEAAKYTVTYSVNGDTSVVPAKNDYVGTSYTLPTASNIAGYTFAGWVESAIGTETTTAPTVLSGSYAVPSTNKTLYAVYTRTEGGSGGGSSNEFTKVTTAPSDWSGDYLIVWEASATDARVFNGTSAIDTYATGTISNGKITNSSDYAVVTIAKMTDGYSLYVDGKGYMKGTSGSNALSYDNSAQLNTIEMGADGVLITSNTSVLRWNNTETTGHLFRYYKSTSYSNQQPIQLYKKGAGGTTYYTTTVNTATTHTLTYSANPAAGGSITCASASGASIEEGTVVSLTAAANTHYTFTGWTVNGASAGSNATLSITMNEAKTVVANFTADPTYTVTLNQVTGGTLVANKTADIYAGEEITVTANPAAHYTYENFSFTGLGVGTDYSVDDNVLTFTMPANNVTVTPTFTEDAKYTVTFYASSLAADTASALSTQSIYGGEYATAPTPGSKDGFTFVGWYTTSGTWSIDPGVLTSATVNSTAVNANVTYYGVWAEGGSAASEYTTAPVQTLDAIDDTVIIDWALPVTFNVLTNDVYNIAVTVNAGSLPSGVANNGNGSFTFTPSDWQTTDETFDYTISGTVNGAPATDTATVTLKTADSVYYEDTYSGIFTFTNSTGSENEWETVSDPNLSNIDDIFAYEKDHFVMYSGGTAKQITVEKGDTVTTSGYVSFSFAGTGFDVISATTNNGGAVLMQIKDANGIAVRDKDGRKLDAIYDNFRGYTYSEVGYTRYTLAQVERGDWDGSTFTANPEGDYYYDRDNDEYKTPDNDKWYTLPEGDTGVYYSIQEAANAFASYESASGTYIIKEYQSHWMPYDISGGEPQNYNTNYYQIPVIRVMGLPYGTYNVTLKPIYSSVYDRAGDGSYDFIFDGVRIHNPVENRAAEYKYISINDAVKAGKGFGSGEVVNCNHQGHEWSDWTFYSKANNTNSETTRNRGSFVQYCSYCHGVANTAYFHVAVTADNTELGVGGYNSLPANTTLRYTLTADAGDNQAAVQAKLDALTGTLTEYWSSNTGAVMTCTNNSSAVIAKGEGTTYATLQLKDPATQTIYASAIHSPMITVYADAEHTHTFGDWTHDANSDPSTHTHTCTGENCSFYETESCVFTSAVTTQPTQSTPGTKTYTCSGCGYQYTETIPALGGHTATFHVPAGATAPAAQTGNSATMPAAVAAPADYDAHSYTFVGWVESTVSDTTTQQTVYTAGTSVTLDDDTDFYALYSYEGEGSGNTYKMVTSEPANWEGKYIIVNPNKDHAMSNTLKSGSNEINASAITVTDNKVVNPSADLIWELTKNPNNASQYSLYNATGNVYAGITGGNSTNASLNSTENFFTIEETGTDNVYDITSVTNSARCFSYYATNATFRTYAKSANNTGYLFKQAGALTYTTNLAETCKHENTTTDTTAATCTAAGYTTVTCDDCDEVISVTPIAALGHYYVPTPAVGGTTYTCSRCNDSYFEADEFEVTYVLQPGVTVSGGSRNVNAITLPTAASIPPTYNAQTYTLVGWADATSADGTSNPTVYEKGEVVNINADTTFYPVYSYTTTSGGSTQEAGYYLADSVPTVGDEIIIAFKSGDTYYALPNGNKSSSASIAAETLTVSNGKATATSTNTFELITNSDHMAIKSTEAANYLGFNSNKISMNGWGDTKYAAISAASNGMFTVYSSNNSPRGLSYSGTNFTVANAGGSPVYIFTNTEGGTGGTTTTTYTFELKAAADSYTVTMSPATLTLFTEASSGVTAMLFNNGNSVDADDYAVEFSSSNTSIVMVDENTGYVLAGETAGTATITATVLAPDEEYYTATCAVTVKEQSDNVTVNYIGSASGYVKNWGTRGTTATFLTAPTASYYTGSYSYATLSALSGDSGSGTDFYSSALGTAIHNMLVAKQTSTTSYDGTRTLYAYTDCVESGNKISSYYSAVLIGPTWDSGSTWNREHTWPKSKALSGTQGDQNDIMMLRPTAKSENSSRGNDAYGESSGYYDPNREGQNLHGDVARLMLQHLMRWGNTSKFYGTGGVMESRAILLKWLAEDPVDTWEMGRNDAVQRITGVRNVFVDYPELAFKLLGAEVPANYTTPSASHIVADATYSASAGSDYEPVTEGAITPNNSPRATAPASARTSIATGSFNGAVIIDGKGTANTFDDFEAYGPNNEVYLAPGQGIVFSLSSDIAITSQDLQIGAKAVNGTATQMDVASISNGTESTGIKYLLENKTIASATEMYYELDTTQMGWNNGESSVLVIYNSGSGVLSVTNLRYSTANNNTLTMNINDVETQSNGSNDGPKGISKMRMAMEMIRIVYGEPITDPDPIEPTDLDLNFASAELVLNSDIAINFNVEEEVMDSADGVYAVFTKALYNDAGDITGYAEETVTEPIFNEETGLYSFRFTGINPAEMGSAVTATLYGYRNGELISGKTVNYSVLDYINRMYAKSDAETFCKLLADLAAYGAAAQNFISYNTANLVTASVAEGLMAYATKKAPELNNATMISGDGAVKFTGAYLSLREKVTVCYMIDAQEYDGNVADLELRIFDGARQIGTASLAEADGKYIASFSGLNAVQMRTVVTAEVYDGDNCVSNTLDYSVESYAASKAAGNDALAALVNAMMSFGISAETYFAK